MRVVAGDRGVDLHRHAESFDVSKSGDRGLEGARNAAEPVVGGCIDAVKTDSHTFYTTGDDLVRDFFGDQGSIGGQRNAKTFVRAILRQLKNIFSEKGLATAQHQNRRGDGGNLIDDVLCRLGGEIVRRAEVGSAGTAMDAAQIAAFRQLPKNQPRFLCGRT